MFKYTVNVKYIVYKIKECFYFFVVENTLEYF